MNIGRSELTSTRKEVTTSAPLEPVQQYPVLVGRRLPDSRCAGAVRSDSVEWPLLSTSNHPAHPIVSEGRTGRLNWGARPQKSLTMLTGCKSLSKPACGSVDDRVKLGYYRAELSRPRWRFATGLGT